MQKITNKIISTILAVSLIFLVGFGTTANAQVNATTPTLNPKGTYTDRIYLNSSSKTPVNSVNRLTNFIDVNYGKNGGNIHVTVQNIAIDSLDSASINFKVFRDGILQINRTFYEYNIAPMGSRTNSVFLNNFDYADITVVTTDGGESYTRPYHIEG